MRGQGQGSKLMVTLVIRTFYFLGASGFALQYTALTQLYTMDTVPDPSLPASASVRMSEHSLWICEIASVVVMNATAGW